MCFYGGTKFWTNPGVIFVARRCSFESLRTVFTVLELWRHNFTGCEAFASVRLRVSIANYQGKLDEFSFK